MRAPCQRCSRHKGWCRSITVPETASTPLQKLSPTLALSCSPAPRPGTMGSPTTAKAGACLWYPQARALGQTFTFGGYPADVAVHVDTSQADVRMKQVQKVTRLVTPSQHGAKTRFLWTNVGTERSWWRLVPARLLIRFHRRTKHAVVLGAQHFVAHAEGLGCAAD